MSEKRFFKRKFIFSHEITKTPRRNFLLKKRHLPRKIDFNGVMIEKRFLKIKSYNSHENTKNRYFARKVDIQGVMCD